MLQLKTHYQTPASNSQPIGTLHAWQDLALNLGKLSLAGLFVTGTIWFMGIYA